MCFHCSSVRKLAQTKLVCFRLKWDLVYGVRCFTINILNEFIKTRFAHRRAEVSPRRICFPWEVTCFVFSCQLQPVLGSYVQTNTHSSYHIHTLNHDMQSPFKYCHLASTLNSPVMKTTNAQEAVDNNTAEIYPFTIAITISKNKLIC